MAAQEVTQSTARSSAHLGGGDVTSLAHTASAVRAVLSACVSFEVEAQVEHKFKAESHILGRTRTEKGLALFAQVANVLEEFFRSVQVTKEPISPELLKSMIEISRFGSSLPRDQELPRVGEAGERLGAFLFARGSFLESPQLLTLPLNGNILEGFACEVKKCVCEGTSLDECGLPKTFCQLAKIAPENGRSVVAYSLGQLLPVMEEPVGRRLLNDTVAGLFADNAHHFLNENFTALRIKTAEREKTDIAGALPANYQKLVEVLQRTEVSPTEKMATILRMGKASDRFSQDALRKIALGLPLTVSPWWGSRSHYQVVDQSLQMAALEGLGVKVLDDPLLRIQTAVLLARNETLYDYKVHVRSRKGETAADSLHETLEQVLLSRPQWPDVEKWLSQARADISARKVLYGDTEPAAALLKLSADKAAALIKTEDLSALSLTDRTRFPEGGVQLQREALRRIVPEYLSELRGQLMPLRDLIRHVGDFSSIDFVLAGFRGIENVGDVLRCQPALMQKLEHDLKKAGYADVSFVANGGSALVVKAQDGKLLRITVSDEASARELLWKVENPRIQHPAILQPDAVIQSGPFKVEVMTELDTSSVTEEDVQVLEKLLLEDGLELPVMDKAGGYLGQKCRGDVRVVNIGKLQDGTPILFDCGSVIKPKGWTFSRTSRHDRWYLEDGREKQSVHS